MGGEISNYDDQYEETNAAPPDSLEQRKVDANILRSITDINLVGTLNNVIETKLSHVI